MIKRVKDVPFSFFLKLFRLITKPKFRQFNVSTLEIYKKPSVAALIQSQIQMKIHTSINLSYRYPLCIFHYFISPSSSPSSNFIPNFFFKSPNLSPPPKTILQEIYSKLHNHHRIELEPQLSHVEATSAQVMLFGFTLAFFESRILR